MSLTVEGKNCLKFFFAGWSGADEISFKMHLGNLGKFLAFLGICLGKKTVQQRSFQTITFPDPHFLFFSSSATGAKLNTIVATC